MVGCMLSRYLFGTLALFVIAVMMHEFYSITMAGNYKVSRALSIVSAAVLFIGFYAYCGFGLEGRMLLLVAVPFILTLASSIFCNDRSRINEFAYITTGFVYVSLPVSLSSFLVFPEGSFSPFLILSVFITIWFSDIGAYAIGTAFGQKPHSRKLCPSISPKKSWIGFWGGLLFALLAALGIFFVGITGLKLVHCLVIAMLIHVGGVCGDLFESQWKRHFGFKDSGNIIPGHGGMLDRFDSTLFAIPLVVVYLKIFSLI